jgi:hypothetical protein
MFSKLTSSNANVVRILVAVSALTMFILSAGAPMGTGG